MLGMLYRTQEGAKGKKSDDNTLLQKIYIYIFSSRSNEVWAILRHLMTCLRWGHLRHLSNERTVPRSLSNAWGADDTIAVLIAIRSWGEGW